MDQCSVRSFAEMIVRSYEPDSASVEQFRINDQFRVCFVWREGNAYEVEIVDYH